MFVYCLIILYSTSYVYFTFRQVRDIRPWLWMSAWTYVKVLEWNELSALPEVEHRLDVRGARRLSCVRVRHHQEMVAVDSHVRPVVSTSSCDVLIRFKLVSARFHAVQHRVYSMVATCMYNMTWHCIRMYICFPYVYCPHSLKERGGVQFILMVMMIIRLAGRCLFRWNVVNFTDAMVVECQFINTLNVIGHG